MLAKDAVSAPTSVETPVVRLMVKRLAGPGPFGPLTPKIVPVPGCTARSAMLSDSPVTLVIAMVDKSAPVSGLIPIKALEGGIVGGGGNADVTSVDPHNRVEDPNASPVRRVTLPG